MSAKGPNHSFFYLGGTFIRLGGLFGQGLGLGPGLDNREQRSLLSCRVRKVFNKNKTRFLLPRDKMFWSRQMIQTSMITLLTFSNLLSHFQPLPPSQAKVKALLPSLLTVCFSYQVVIWTWFPHARSLYADRSSTALKKNITFLTTFNKGNLWHISDVIRM